MNKESGIHTLGRGNLGNINAKYPLQKPNISKSSVESDAADGHGCHATAIEGNVGESSHDATTSLERDSKQQNDGDKTDSFHALISKFEKRESTPTKSTQRKENHAGIAVHVGDTNALECSVVESDPHERTNNTSFEGKTSKEAIAAESSEDNSSPIPAAVSNRVGEMVDKNSQIVGGVIHGKNNKFHALLSKFERMDDKCQQTGSSPQLTSSPKVANSAGESGSAPESTHPRSLNTDNEIANTPTNPNKDSIQGVTVAVAKKSSSKVKIPSFLRSKSKSDSLVVDPESPPSTKTQAKIFSLPPSCPQVNQTADVTDDTSKGNLDCDLEKYGEKRNNAAPLETTSTIPPFDNVTDDEKNRIIGKKKSIDELISKFERADEPRKKLSQQERRDDTKDSEMATSDPRGNCSTSVTPNRQSIQSQVVDPSQPSKPSDCDDAKAITYNNKNVNTPAPADDAEVIVVSSIQSSEKSVRKELTHNYQVAKVSANALDSKFRRKEVAQIVQLPPHQGTNIAHIETRATDLNDVDKSPTLIPTSTSENEGNSPRHDANRESVTKSTFSMKFPSFLKTRSKSEPAVPVNHTKQPLSSGNIIPSDVKEVATGSQSMKDMKRDENKCDNHIIKEKDTTKSGGFEKTRTSSESLGHASGAKRLLLTTNGNLKSDAPLQSMAGLPKQVPRSNLPSTTKQNASFLASRSKSASDTVNNKRQTHQTETKHNKGSNSNLKKNSFTKQHPSKQLNTRVHRKSKTQARPPPTDQSTSQPRKNTFKPPDLNLHSIPQKSDCTSISPRYNMVSPKSHQRLVLEKMAAQYFLNDPKLSDANYVGVTEYADEDASLTKGGRGLGNIDENFDLIAKNAGTTSKFISMVASKAREDVIMFLEGTDTCATDDNDITLAETKSSININETTSESPRSNNEADAEQSQNIMMETNIDVIFELANDHLSLGRNDLALQAYCRAMKIAFADVLSVKKKLAKLKHEQGDSSPTELIKEQEQLLESSLLDVASRVADVHNNMGVVYEMNCQFEAARTSYSDALEVYHKTCKRIEEQGDPDVDRTKHNIDRMEMACSSEKQRKELHQKSSHIAQKLEQESHSAKRKSLLIEAVDTLRAALKLETSTVGSTHPVTASTLIQLGKYHYEMRDFDSAVTEIRKATTILRTALGDNHPQVGKSTLLLASIYERHGVHVSPQGTTKDDVELELYVDALGPLKAALGEVNTEIGLLYQKIGHLYGKKGDSNLSLLAYKASLKAYGEPTFPVTERLQLEVVSIWVRVTEISTFLKEWDEVLISGHRALYLLRNLKNTLFRFAQVANNSNSGNESTNRQSSVMPASSSKASGILISADMYYESLFNTLQSLGQAQTSLTNYSLARDACLESLQLAWEMALSTLEPNAVLRVIRALKRLGKALLLGKQYNLALQCFLPCLELLRSSKETESSLDCASVLGSIGYLYLKLGKFTESSNFLRECLRLHKDHEVDKSNDRETRKVQAWLQLAESREGEVSVGNILSEIPTIFVDETKKFGG